MIRKTSIKWAVSILMFVGLTWVGSADGGELFLVAAGLLAILGCGMRIVIGAFYRDHKEGDFFPALFLLTILAAFASSMVGGLNGSATQENADSVIAALEQYKTSHGRYPESLERLVPEYFPSVPKTRIGWPVVRDGKSFGYKPIPEGFRLGYSLPGFMYRGYDSTVHQWKSHD